MRPAQRSATREGGAAVTGAIDWEAARARVQAEKKQKVYIGNTVCNDRFYRLPESYRSGAWRDYGILCSEMEGAALYTAAAQFHRRALMLVSILSHLEVDEEGREHIRPLPEMPGKTMDDALLLALATVAEDKRRSHGSL